MNKFSAFRRAPELNLYRPTNSRKFGHLAVRNSVRNSLFWVGIIVLLLIPAQGNSARAQGQIIKYGDRVSGEITEATTDIQYRFSGTKDDVVILSVERDGSVSGNQLEPTITLSDVNNHGLIGSSEASSANTAPPTLMLGAAILPANADYTITVSRKGGKTGTTIGNFVVGLSLARVLTTDEPISATTTVTAPLYFVVGAGAPSGVGLDFQQVITNADRKFCRITTYGVVAGNSTLPTGLLTPQALLITDGISALTMNLNKPEGPLLIIKVEPFVVFQPYSMDFKVTLRAGK